MAEKPRIPAIVVRVAEYALAALFLYLGVTKLLTPGPAAPARTILGVAEMIVGALLLIRASDWVSTPAVITVAVTEVVLFNRPPLAAVACVAAHGLTSWARRTLPGIQYECEPGPFLYGPHAERRVRRQWWRR